MTDQWAHAGGLVAGALLGLVLSPNARWHKIGLHVSRVVALAFVVAAAATAVLVARTSTADSLARDWRACNVDLVPAGDSLDAAVTDVLQHYKDNEVGEARPVVTLPAGWRGKELVLVELDSLENRQHTRIIVAARPDGMAFRLEAPDTTVRAAPAFFADLLARQ